MNKQILIYGGGGHAKTVIDLIQALDGWTIAGIVDDGIAAGTRILGIPVSGGSEVLPALKADGVDFAVNAVGGIGNYTVRWAVFERLQKLGFSLPTLVHPTACIESSVHLADAVQVLAKSYVSSASEIGFGSLINAGVILSHDCKLGRCVNLSPGALLAGGVTVKDFAQIGMGATINLNLTIGEAARVGNGATVKDDVPDAGRVYAGAVWPDPSRYNLPEKKTYRKIA